MKKWIADLLKRMKKRREENSLVRNVNLFYKLIRDPRTGMDAVMHTHVERMARAKIMNWLDARGTIHCRFCEVTSPLRNVNDTYMCQTHAPRPAEKVQVAS